MPTMLRPCFPPGPVTSARSTARFSRLAQSQGLQGHEDILTMAWPRPHAAVRVQRVLRAYAGRLTAKLPRPASGQAQAMASAHSTEWHVRMDDAEADVACTIVCTADYCQGVVGDLGSSVGRMLDPPLGEQVWP